MAAPVPVVYVTDLAFDQFDPADLFDLASLLRSPDHRLVGVCLNREDGSGERVLDALSLHAAAGGVIPPLTFGAQGLATLLQGQDEPVNLVVVAGYAVVADVLDDTTLFRGKVGRLFIVGGHANDYASSARRLPIAPRLRERYPARYAAEGDPRMLPEDHAAWAKLLTSGQAVIFLPRDISLWSYAAPGVLTGGGATSDFLLRELFWSHLASATDRYAAAGQPVLLSSLPALLLAVKPDPFVWMRLFRVITARVTVGEGDRIAEIDPASESPNLYLLTAIDGQALGKLLTALLRDGSVPPGVQ